MNLPAYLPLLFSNFLLHFISFLLIHLYFLLIAYLPNSSSNLDIFRLNHLLNFHFILQMKFILLSLDSLLHPLYFSIDIDLDFEV